MREFAVATVEASVSCLFVAEERGTHELKGAPEPVTLFRIVFVPCGHSLHHAQNNV